MRGDERAEFTVGPGLLPGTSDSPEHHVDRGDRRVACGAGCACRPLSGGAAHQGLARLPARPRCAIDARCDRRSDLEVGGAAMTIQCSADVVICTYTEARWTMLVRSVSSVLAQSVVPDKVIVVVDHNSELAAKCRDQWCAGVTEQSVPVVVVENRFAGRL